MGRDDSVGKTLMLGKIEGRKRRGQQRMRLYGHEFEQSQGDGEGWRSWHAAAHGVAKSQTRLCDWTTIADYNTVFVSGVLQNEPTHTHPLVFTFLSHIGSYRVLSRLPCTIQYLLFSHSVMSDSLWPNGLQPTRLLCPRDFSGKNTGVVTIFCSTGPSQPRNWTCISCKSPALQVDFITPEPPFYMQ